MSGKGFTHESARNESIEWYTPPEIFDSLNMVFDLDPCSSGKGKTFVPAKKYLTVEDDGLNQDWVGTAFVNPPYGPQTEKWMRKLAEHGDGMGLIFARTDVKWFHDVGIKADLVCFVKGRIKFYKGGIDKSNIAGTPGAGSMILAYGEKSTKALLKSGLGACFKYIEGPSDES